MSAFLRHLTGGLFAAFAVAGILGSAAMAQQAPGDEMAQNLQLPVELVCGDTPEKINPKKLAFAAIGPDRISLLESTTTPKPHLVYSAEITPIIIDAENRALRLRPFAGEQGQRAAVRAVCEATEQPQAAAVVRLALAANARPRNLSPADQFESYIDPNTLASASVTWPRNVAKGVKLGQLLSRYLDARGEILLIRRTDALTPQSQVERFLRMSWVADARPGAVPKAPSDRRAMKQAQAPAQPSPSPTEATPAARFAKPVEATNPPVRKDFLLGFKRPELPQNLDHQFMVDHFGYCQATELRSGKVALLGCLLPENGGVPLVIRGFKPVTVSANVTNLDDTLEVEPFSVPLPPNWAARPQFLRIEGGLLPAVLAREFALEQGPAGCQAKMRPSIKGILTRRLEWPEPPCLPYSVAVPADMMARRPPTLTSGCMPGDEAVAMTEGRISCWFKRDRQAPSLRIEWAPGFHPLSRPVSQEEILSAARIVLSKDDVLGGLEAIWPYGPAFSPLAPSPAMPIYAASTVAYMVDNQACGNEIPLRAGDRGQTYRLPTVLEAGCSRVPTQARVRFTLNASATDRKLELAAFQTEFSEVFVIGQHPRSKPAVEVKRELPVRFNPAVGQDYDRKFGTGIGNPRAVLEVYPDAEGCERVTTTKLVRLAGGGDPVTERWPLFGLVRDSRDNLPNTDCASAVIEKDASGEPFLTFELKGSRATGPRRVIVIARSEQFDRAVGKGALTAALGTLVDEAKGNEQRDIPLSPITVYSVTGEGRFVRLFRGEDAARNPDQIKRRINAEIEGGAPTVPPLDQLDNQQDLPRNGFDRLIIVMDGAQPDTANLGMLALIVNRIARSKPDNVVLLLATRNCEAWQRVGEIACEYVAQSRDARDRQMAMTSVFRKLLNGAAEK